MIRDAAIPGEVPVPHMQRAGQTPIFADSSVRYPVVVLSHGLGGSPLDSAYLQAMQYFASHGYVVIAPFHADARFSRIRVEDFRRGQLVNLRIFFNRKYCTSPGRGIEDVLFKNISYTGSHAEVSVISGYDDARQVR